jgi:hypothetical protein
MQECEKLTIAQNDCVAPLSWGQKLPKTKRLLKSTNTMTNYGKDKPNSKLEWET